MEVSKRRLLSKPKPERVQEKTMKSVHRVLKERRLFRTQICTQGETEPARKSGLKRKTESVQNKPLNSVNRVQKKRKLTDIIQSPVPAQEKQERKPGLTMKPNCPVPAQEKQERKPGLTMKPNCVEKPKTFIDGAVKKGRLMETGNQQEKKINTKISLKSREAEEKERVQCNWRKTKFDRERQKQREAARLVLEQVKNTCGLTDNMDSMRDFEKIVGCSSTFYIFSRDRRYCYD